MLRNIKVNRIFPGLRYMPGDSIMYRVHPLVKLIALVLYSIAVFAFSRVTAALSLFLLLLILFRIADLGLLFFIRKLKFILFFGFFILVVQLLVVHDGYLLLQYTLLGRLKIELWSEGLASGLIMMLRFVNIIGSSYLFISTTDPNKLVYGLMQAGLPYRYGFMLITSLRFIPVFQQELSLIRNAQMAKGIDLQGVSLKKLYRAVKYLLTPLVICALNKVDYLAISMESRAFGLYSRRSFLFPYRMERRDWLILGVVVFLFIISCIWFFRTP